MLLESEESASGDQVPFVCNTVEEAVEKATRCSHYQGTDRDRLYLAVLQTVIGELPLTQAAATHSVPFSTLHPYVKRAKLYLGMPIQQNNGPATANAKLQPTPPGETNQSDK